jgi:hypothetical protein
MKAIAIWIVGLPTSMVAGGVIGAWTFDTDIGLLWGILAGAFLFAFLQLWFRSPNELKR